jgi:hypothetical protein
MISDTPAEAEPSFGCEIGRDTCSSEGEDPVQNFMDYSEDNCLSQFTTEQTERMIAQWNMYRSDGGSTPTPSVPTTQPPVSSPPPSPPTSIPSTSTRTVTIKVVTDKFPDETGWTLSQGDTLIYTQAAGTYHKSESTYTHTFNNLAPGAYKFLITDSESDGLCCEWGEGSVSITSKNDVLLGVKGTFKEILSQKFEVR